MANPPSPKPATPARRKSAARKPATRKAGARKAPAKASTSPSTLAWSLGGLALAAGAGLVAFLTRGRIATLVAEETSASSGEGHVPTDLLDPNRNVDDRAVADFRPNMDAPMTAAEREALRPATGPAPTLSADRGDLRSEV